MLLWWCGGAFVSMVVSLGLRVREGENYRRVRSWDEVGVNDKLGKEEQI